MHGGRSSRGYRRAANIVVTCKEGVSIYYRIAGPRSMQAFDLITRVMLGQMAREEDAK